MGNVSGVQLHSFGYSMLAGPKYIFKAYFVQTHQKTTGKPSFLRPKANLQSIHLSHGELPRLQEADLLPRSIQTPLKNDASRFFPFLFFALVLLDCLVTKMALVDILPHGT